MINSEIFIGAVGISASAYAIGIVFGAVVRLVRNSVR